MYYVYMSFMHLIGYTKRHCTLYNVYMLYVYDVGYVSISVLFSFCVYFLNMHLSRPILYPFSRAVDEVNLHLRPRRESFKEKIKYFAGNDPA